jgi:hypothetical protein
LEKGRKKKYDMVLVQMVLFENSTPHATPEYVYSQEFLNIGYKIKYPCKS